MVSSLQVRVREFYIAMQRCPYIHEMKERLLGAPVDGVERDQRTQPEPIPDPQVGTIVK
ncbi:jg26215, partial [Pararge aegeria aegeria]